MDKLSALRGGSLFSVLEDGELETLSQLFVERHMESDRVIFQEGDSADALYLLLEGKVKVMLTDADGHEVIVSVLRGGDCFGEMALLDAGRRSAQIMTMAPSRFLVLASADFRGWIERNPRLAMAIIHQLSRRLRQANQTINSLATLDVKSRVARVLLEGAEQRVAEGMVIEMPTQTDLAKMVGASRERVNRALKTLEDEGFLRVDGHRAIITG